MTFDLKESSCLTPGVAIYDTLWESFGVCRRCQRGTIFKIIRQHKTPHTCTSVDSTNNKGPVTVSDRDARPSPEHVPPDIAEVFQEGAKCLAIGCFNAAATMFRLVVEMSTEELLPDAEPSKGTRMLSPRLDWLFKNGKLPKGLKDLASVVAIDGNDGAHRGTVDQETAEDLVNFTERLLTQMYTEPEKIELAKKRATERTAAKGNNTP